MEIIQSEKGKQAKECAVIHIVIACQHLAIIKIFKLFFMECYFDSDELLPIHNNYCDI